MDEFKLNECDRDSGNRGAIWTEAETLLLLESVWKHGDDWELVTQNVQTKSKLDCILKLNELPFGELMFSSKHKSNVPPFSGALTFLERLMIERLILLPHFYFVVFR
jgi:SWI/SNF related-matrix-associated actin-dependent regulator of chromatin subfamily C